MGIETAATKHSATDDRWLAAIAAGTPTTGDCSLALFERATVDDAGPGDDDEEDDDDRSGGDVGNIDPDEDEGYGDEDDDDEEPLQV